MEFIATQFSSPPRSHLLYQRDQCYGWALGPRPARKPRLAWEPGRHALHASADSLPLPSCRACLQDCVLQPQPDGVLCAGELAGWLAEEGGGPRAATSRAHTGCTSLYCPLPTAHPPTHPPDDEHGHGHLHHRGGRARALAGGGGDGGHHCGPPRPALDPGACGGGRLALQAPRPGWSGALDRCCNAVGGTPIAPPPHRPTPCHALQATNTYGGVAMLTKSNKIFM